MASLLICEWCASFEGANGAACALLADIVTHPACVRFTSGLRYPRVSGVFTRQIQAIMDRWPGIWRLSSQHGDNCGRWSRRRMERKELKHDRTLASPADCDHSGMRHCDACATGAGAAAAGGENRKRCEGGRPHLQCQQRLGARLRFLARAEMRLC